MTATLTVEIDEADKAELDKLAKERHQPTVSMLAEIVSEFVREQRVLAAAHDDTAFLAAVDQGLASIAAGRVHDHEDVVARIKARRLERAR